MISDLRIDALLLNFVHLSDTDWWVDPDHRLELTPPVCSLARCRSTNLNSDVSAVGGGQ